MPELPEVEMMRRGLFPVVGRTIERVEFPVIPYRPIAIQPSSRSLAARCKRKKIVSIERIAKRVLVQLSSGDRIVLQPKMAGIVMLDDPPSAQHTRVIFHLQGSGQPRMFQYWDRRGLGTVSIWSPQEVDLHLGGDILGPDALSISQSEFRDRILDCRREVKAALLDQRIVAGVGNIYAAEILLAARVHPQAQCNRLSAKQCGRIHREMVRILNQAIEFEGSTLSDGTYRNAINGEGRFQNQHMVYDREGKVCRCCGRAKVLRIVQAQRSSYYCPRCQKLPGSRSS